MVVLTVILVLALIGAVATVVGAPLRRRAAASAGAGVSLDALGLDELQAAREAKYREIRDAELDFRTGKLSREDYEKIDADLRAEAIEILDRLERLTRDA